MLPVLVPSWLDLGALINVDAPALHNSRPVGASRKVFILGYGCTQSAYRPILLVAYNLLNRVLIKEAILVLE